MFRTSTVPRSATLWMIKRPAFLLLDAGIEAVDADAVLEASVPVVSHPERSRRQAQLLTDHSRTSCNSSYPEWRVDKNRGIKALGPLFQAMNADLDQFLDW